MAIALFFFAALGAALGSFAALVADRMLRGQPLIMARSACEGCQEVIAPWHLIPLLSWPLLRGRCARCAAPIPPRLFHAEIAGAIAGMAALLATPTIWHALILLAWITALLALALADLRAFRLPDPIVGVAAVLGVALAFVGDGTGWPPLSARLTDAALGGVCGAGAFWALRAGYARVTGRQGMGLGDVKLMGALGLALGVQALPMTVLLAAVACLVLALLRAARRGRDLNRLGAVPFGAALAVSACLVRLAL